MNDNAEWLNFRWAIDVDYAHMDLVPILSKLVAKYGKFWDGQYWYIKQSCYILRWPDWRDKYRVDLESWKRHHGINDRIQLKLTRFIP